MILKNLYIVFLGILLSLFVGVGIAAFYPSPKSPERPAYTTPIYDSTKTPSVADQEKQRKEDEKWQKIFNDYQQKLQMYNRDISIFSLVLAIAFLIVSFIVVAKLSIMSDGFLLGGLFTLIYSIVRGFGSNDSKYRFVVVAISLGIALALGYLKFIKPQQKK